MKIPFTGPLGQVGPRLTGLTTRSAPADQAPRRELALQSVTGNVTTTAATMTAWYVLPEVSWAFRDDGSRNRWIDTVAEQLAELAGARIHLRHTTLPYPVAQWLRHRRTDSQPLPDQMVRDPNTGEIFQAPTWRQHLAEATSWLDDQQFDTGLTLIGVEFTNRSLFPGLTRALTRRASGAPNRRELDRVAEQVRHFEQVLAGHNGLAAYPATEWHIATLLYRSVGIGLSITDRWLTRFDAGDLPALTEHVEYRRGPYDVTTEVINRLRQEERQQVAVLTIAQMDELEIPERHEPWLHLLQRLPFPTEVSIRADLLTPDATTRAYAWRRKAIRSQQDDYRSHNLDSPPELDRNADHVLEVEDAITTGRPVDSTRVQAWIRIAVYGGDLDEVLARVDMVKKLYRDHARVDVCHPKDQFALMREFIPGEPLANTGYVRRMGLHMLAAAVPHASPEVGDRRGDLLGYTCGTGRLPFMLDPHYPTEVLQISGVGVFAAKPGGGKSTAAGAMAYMAARRGVQTTILDPSGPLARLADMPEFAGRARVVDLVGAHPGTLAPYALIPTPRRGEFPRGQKGDGDYHQAVDAAAAERRLFAEDIIRLLLPPQLADSPEVATRIRLALLDMPATETTTLEDVIAVLNRKGHTDIAQLLHAASTLPNGLLFFGRAPAALLTTAAPLTIITMTGLRLPEPGTPRVDWTAEESMALPMLHTAYRLAVRRAYSGPVHTRKLVLLDEAHMLNEWRSGRAFIKRLARDSRKWNLAAYLFSQNPGDLLALDIINLVSTVFVGRCVDDDQVTSDALRLLGLPTGAGYETTVAGLSNTAPLDGPSWREFLVRDVNGRVNTVRVDLSWAPDLLNVLNTTPTSPARQERAA